MGAAFLTGGTTRRALHFSTGVHNGDSFGVAVKEFALNQGCWQGTVVALLEALWPDSDGPPPRDWPKPTPVWTKIKRFLPQLRADGITIDQSRANDRKRTRLITIAVAEASDGDVARPDSDSSEDLDWGADHPADLGSVAAVTDDGDDRQDEIPF